MSDSQRTPSSKSPDLINNNRQERSNAAELEPLSKPLDTDRKRSRSPQDTNRDSSAKEVTRTRSPRRSDDRIRSRSPRDDRQQKKPRRKDAGFKWKEKRRDEDENRDEGLRRGYRDQYKPRRRSRSRSRSRERSGYGDNQERDRDSKRPRRRSRSRSRSPRRYDLYRGGRDDQKDRNRDRDRQREDRSDRGKRGDERYPKNNSDRQPISRPAPPSSAPTAPPQEMIQVTINDRLGTKKQIPCLPSDTIKDFKAVVAMMIGRRPHEILLKRQSERPFKDFLTLQDYGVSNGSSLDLEVDTGD